MSNHHCKCSQILKYVTTVELILFFFNCIFLPVFVGKQKNFFPFMTFSKLFIVNYFSLVSDCIKPICKPPKCSDGLIHLPFQQIFPVIQTRIMLKTVFVVSLFLCNLYMPPRILNPTPSLDLNADGIHFCLWRSDSISS